MMMVKRYSPKRVHGLAGAPPGRKQAEEAAVRADALRVDPPRPHA